MLKSSILYATAMTLFATQCFMYTMKNRFNPFYQSYSNGVGVINAWSWSEIYQARKKTRRNKIQKRYR